MFPFDYFKKRKAAKAKIEREAELLILVMKDKALGFATENLIKASPEEEDHLTKVRRSVKRRLGISSQADTATRYLMND
jgi:hypothetical protein